MRKAYPIDAGNLSLLKRRLQRRSVVLVGLMGCGKTSIGRRMGQKLGLSFVDSDHEIEHAHGMTVPEIWEKHGESYFRAGEVRVISRLLDRGPLILATGGGAFMNEETRANLKAKAITIWLNADLETLMKRVSRRQDRPLLKSDDPKAVMQGLMDTRYPIYKSADLSVITREIPQEHMADETIRVLKTSLGLEPAW
jgi:shikimate kinase